MGDKNESYAGIGRHVAEKSIEGLGFRGGADTDDRKRLLRSHACSKLPEPVRLRVLGELPGSSPQKGERALTGVSG
jgi:hypothetical protein